MLQSILSIWLLSGSSIGAEESSPPVFNLHAATGIVAQGSLEQVREDWSISLRGSKAIQVSGSEVIALRPTKRVLPPSPRQAHVLLTNGDRLPGTPLQLSGERVRFSARLGAEQELNLPLSAITLFWFGAPDGAENGQLLPHRMAAERRQHDIILLTNGDMVEGTLTAVDSEMIQIDNAAGKEIKIVRGKVTALALSTELARSLRPKGPYGRLVLANGGRLSLLSGRADGQMLVGKTVFGATIQIPVNQIVALDVRQGRADYLSDLKPLRYEHTPYLGVRWPYALDTSVAGNELRVGGQP